MSNGNMGGGGGGNTSVWPVITIIVGVIALALAGWDSVLARQNRELKDRVEKLETWQKGADAKDKAEEAAAERARRKARAAAAQQGGGGGETKPADKGSNK
jgi:hypothetical protein